MVRIVEEYRDRAEEYRRLAAQMDNPDHKKQLVEMAATWEMFARERVKLLELQAREPPEQK